MNTSFERGENRTDEWYTPKWLIDKFLSGGGNFDFKIWKRVQKWRKLEIPETTHVDKLRPILDAIRRVDPKNGWCYVTDKKFEEMIKPYKAK